MIPAIQNLIFFSSSTSLVTEKNPTDYFVRVNLKKKKLIKPRKLKKKLLKKPNHEKNQIKSIGIFKILTSLVLVL